MSTDLPDEPLELVEHVFCYGLTQADLESLSDRQAGILVEAGFLRVHPTHTGDGAAPDA